MADTPIQPQLSNASTSTRTNWPLLKACKRAVAFGTPVWNIGSKLIWLAALALIALLLYESFQVTTAIEPIAVPKALAEAGYTPEVAAQRLRNALNKFATDVEKDVKVSPFALRTELPNIVVPTVGLSLDTITSSIQRLVNNPRRRVITGEFTVKNGLLWLHLRVDGEPQYSSDKGVDPEKPDELLADAAPAIFDNFEPLFFVASYRYKDPAKGLEVADAVIARFADADPRAAPLYDMKAVIYYEQGDIDKALIELEKAKARDPRLPYVHGNLGIIFHQQERYDDAVAAFNRAIKLKHVSAHVGLGYLFIVQKKYEQARASFRKATELNPKFVAAHVGLGDALYYQGKGKYGEALAAYREALRLDRKDVNSRIGIAIVLHATGNTGAAIPFLRQALELRPNDSVAHSTLGTYLKSLGMKDAAIDELREALRLDPKSAFTHNELGNAFFEEKKYDEALASYREAVRLKPGEAIMRSNLGMTLQTLGMKEAASREFREALRLDPKLAFAHNQLGNAFFEEKKYDEALASYREAVGLKPGDAIMRSNLGGALQALGKKGEASAAFREALGLDPKNERARQGLAEATK